MDIDDKNSFVNQYSNLIRWLVFVSEKYAYILLYSSLKLEMYFSPKFQEVSRKELTNADEANFFLSPFDINSLQIFDIYKKWMVLIQKTCIWFKIN